MHSLLNLLAQSNPPALDVLALHPLTIWNSVWPYLLMLLGFSFIVFVHELGHFAVAKWAGVRVEKFAIGFGRELFGFSKGETRYSFNLLPLGGYVKMLGQEDFDDKANELKFNDNPRSFVNKPVGVRMAIISAGVIMNLIFAALLFMVVFLVGKEEPGTRIGFVVPDTPAQKAGLLPGDRVIRINGSRMHSFKDIQMAVLLAPPNEPIRFSVERDGQEVGPIPVMADFSWPKDAKDFRRQMVGISYGATREIGALRADIDTSREDQPHIGDMLVEVDGQPVTDENVNDIMFMLPYAAGEIVVERLDPDDPDAPPKRVRIQVETTLGLQPSNRNDPDSVNILGLTPLAKFSSIQERGRASLAGIEQGDTILSWDDIDYPTRTQIARAVHECAERDIPVSVRKSDGRIVETFIRPKRWKKGPATIHAGFIAVETDGGADHAEPRVEVALLRPGGIAARAGLAQGDLIVELSGEVNPIAGFVRKTVANGRGARLSIKVRKPDGREVDTVVEPTASGGVQARFDVVSDEPLCVGEVLAGERGRPSPAAEAGIGAGACIRKINDVDVGAWRELIEQFRLSAGTTVQLTYENPDGYEHVVPFRVPHSIRTLLGVGPLARIITVDGRSRVRTETHRGEEEVAVGYHGGTLAILLELVGKKHVAVTYRENPLADLQTAYIDVTDDMVDPWLGRVNFHANFDVLVETVLLKGDGALDAVWIGVRKTYYFVHQVFTIISRMVVSRSVGLDTLSGPLGIVHVGGRLARTDYVEFLFFLAMISANLAVINFLPLPIVDGGLMVFLMIEKIKGSPVSLRVQVATQMLGVVLIVGAFLYVTFNDALRVFG